MHFIGMLALELPVPVTSNALEVGLSVLVAIAASTLALTVASGPALGRRRLAVAGAALGAAIVGMHYTAMAALIRYGGHVEYDTPLGEPCPFSLPWWLQSSGYSSPAGLETKMPRVPDFQASGDLPPES